MKMAHPSARSVGVVAVTVLATACTNGLDFDGLSSDFGRNDVAVALTGKRVELACTDSSADAPYLCASQPRKEVKVSLAGGLGHSYDLKLRFRGVVEMTDYTGGDSRQSPMYAGGMPSGAGRNVYALAVSDPAKTYYLNAGTTALYCTPIDYTATITAQGNATLTLTADPGDAQQLKNLDGSGTPIVVPGVPPLNEAFAGQFIQIDVVTVGASL
jgi:hypothetical protein